MWEREVRAKIDQALKAPQAEKVAVFDVDGTLWREDIGEEFFKDQIANRTAPGLGEVSDPWAYYQELEKTDAPLAYGWLAQINGGVAEADLRKECRSFYEERFTGHIREPMKKLVKELQANRFDIWICSASIRWTLEPAVEELGVPFDHLIATEVMVDPKGLLTETIVEPVPYAAGKKHWVSRKLQTPPLIVAGNSSGDTEMLGLATILPLVVLFEPHRAETKTSAEKLLAYAKKKGWLTQVFR
jgi:HAD superfamily phosphoserine phosphatase-like hydrolase